MGRGARAEKQKPEGTGVLYSDFCPLPSGVLTMSPPLAAAVPLVLAYLVGALPFGYLVGRLRGVNLFAAGSGNIGATNAARVLGWRFGALVFVFDFLKGALPVALAVPLAESLSPGASTRFGSPDVLRVGAAALAFLGHLFPVYLGFRGGKGIATGAGTNFVLVPVPAALAVAAWAVVLFASRIVSLASLAAVAMLVSARLAGNPAPPPPAQRRDECDHAAHRLHREVAREHRAHRRARQRAGQRVLPLL